MIIPVLGETQQSETERHCTEEQPLRRLQQQKVVRKTFSVWCWWIRTKLRGVVSVLRYHKMGRGIGSLISSENHPGTVWIGTCDYGEVKGNMYIEWHDDIQMHITSLRLLRRKPSRQYKDLFKQGVSEKKKSIEGIHLPSHHPMIADQTGSLSLLSICSER